MRELKITEYVDDTIDKSVTIPKEQFKGLTFRNQAEATRKHQIAEKIEQNLLEGTYASQKELAFELHNILGLGKQRAADRAAELWSRRNDGNDK